MCPKIDTGKFESYLRRNFDCGKDGLDIEEFVSIHYGKDASAFLRELLYL